MRKANLIKSLLENQEEPSKATGLMDSDPHVISLEADKEFEEIMIELGEKPYILLGAKDE